MKMRVKFVFFKKVVATLKKKKRKIFISCKKISPSTLTEGKTHDKLSLTFVTKNNIFKNQDLFLKKINKSKIRLTIDLIIE